MHTHKHECKAGPTTGQAYHAAGAYAASSAVVFLLPALCAFTSATNWSSTSGALMRSAKVASLGAAAGGAEAPAALAASPSAPSCLPASSAGPAALMHAKVTPCGINRTESRKIRGGRGLAAVPTRNPAAPAHTDSTAESHLGH